MTAPNTAPQGNNVPLSWPGISVIRVGAGGTFIIKNWTVIAGPSRKYSIDAINGRLAVEATMTFIKLLGMLDLLVGLALLLTTDAPGHGCEPGKHGTMTVFDGKDDFGGFLVRDGDRFMVVHVGKDAKVPPRNFTKSGDLLWVDDRYMGFDLSGKDKNVLVRELPNRKRTARDHQNIEWKVSEWETLRTPKGEVLVRRFQVANGELKGWWIGLGPVEKERKGEPRPKNRRGERAPLILVKDKKDAAGFDWTRPEDE